MIRLGLVILLFLFGLVNLIDFFIENPEQYIELKEHIANIWSNIWK